MATNPNMKARLDEAEVIKIWSTPDWSILNAGRRDPVAMPSELLGPAWPLLQSIAKGTATPVDYPALGYLVACASLIGGKRRVRPYTTSHWSEPCILWAGVVGDPSSRKSPALDAIIDPLRVLERDGADLHKRALRDWKEADGKAKAVRAEWEKAMAKAIKEGAANIPSMPDGADDPDEPSRRRTLVMDATPEAVGAILAGNPMGTLYFRDELAGWLTSFDRYSPGGREFWLEAYGGRSFTIDRKNMKAPLSISFNGVSVLGGIQPAKLAAALLGSPDDGLTARFLWAWPDKVPFRRPRAVANVEYLETVYRRLEGLAWGMDQDGKQVAVTIPLSADASDIFEAWERDNAAIDEDTGSLFKSFVGKMDGVVLRLALAAEYAAWAYSGGDEPAEVSARSLVAACAWVDDYGKPMALRVYGDAALPKVERDAAVLGRYIVKLGERTINKRALVRSPHKSEHNLTGQALAEALDHLVGAEWLREAPSRAGDMPGRPKQDYIVNPAVLEGRP